MDIDIIYNEDCLEVLKRLEDNSIDAIVTDPPYNLGFMGKKWDRTGIAFNLDLWKECLRVIKPGGNLLSFGGTRTYHRMVCAIEDAGFEIRDCIMWVYGSGFPKSLNIGKAVDKLQGNKREVVGIQMLGGNAAQSTKEKGGTYASNTNAVGVKPIEVKLTKGTSEWEGYGTGLKPAYEPIVLARKPISEKTIAENCLKWGVGGLNIDGCRVEYNNVSDKPTRDLIKQKSTGGNQVPASQGDEWVGNNKGRFPANLILDGLQEVMELFPNTDGGGKPQQRERNLNTPVNFASANRLEYTPYSDTFNGGGSAARFFYCAKSSRSERNIGLDNKVTVKYNIPNGGVLCKDEFMVAALLLQKVISGLTAHWSKDEFGDNITAQFHRDISSTILMETNKITELKILPSLMHLLTSEYTQDVGGLTENGGSLAESVVSLREYLLNITNDNWVLALGASRVVSEMLLRISVKENWEENYNFHATVKPLALMEYLVKLVTRPGHIVLDPFIGSGTTAMACVKLDRHYIGCELDKGYYDIAIKRIAQVDK